MTTRIEIESLIVWIVIFQKNFFASKSQENRIQLFYATILSRKSLKFRTVNFVYQNFISISPWKRWSRGIHNKIVSDLSIGLNPYLHWSYNGENWLSIQSWPRSINYIFHIFWILKENFIFFGILKNRISENIFQQIHGKLVTTLQYSSSRLTAFPIQCEVSNKNSISSKFPKWSETWIALVTRFYLSLMKIIWT